MLDNEKIKQTLKKTCFHKLGEIKKELYEDVEKFSTKLFDNCKFPNDVYNKLKKAKVKSKKFIMMNPVKTYGFIQTFLS